MAFAWPCDRPSSHDSPTPLGLCVVWDGDPTRQWCPQCWAVWRQFPAVKAGVAGDPAGEGQSDQEVVGVIADQLQKLPLGVGALGQRRHDPGGDGERVHPLTIGQPGIRNEFVGGEVGGPGLVVARYQPPVRRATGWVAPRPLFQWREPRRSRRCLAGSSSLRWVRARYCYLARRWAVLKLEDVDGRTLLTPAEAAELLGRSPETIRRWVRRGVVPGFRDPGGRLHVRWGDVAPRRVPAPEPVVFRPRRPVSRAAEIGRQVIEERIRDAEDRQRP